jgi:hypothetical protein
MINANYFGPVDEGMRYLDPFIALGPSETEILTVPWNRVTSTSYFRLDEKACKKGQYINMYSIGRNRTDVSIYESFFDDLTDFYSENPDILTFFVIHRFPTQAVLAVPDEETAYPHRHLKMHMYVSSIYPTVCIGFAVSNRCGNSVSSKVLMPILPSALLWTPSCKLRGLSSNAIVASTISQSITTLLMVMKALKYGTHPGSLPISPV